MTNNNNKAEKIISEAITAVEESETDYKNHEVVAVLEEILVKIKESISCPFCVEIFNNKYELIAHWLKKQNSDLQGDWVPHQMIKIIDKYAEHLSKEKQRRN